MLAVRRNKSQSETLVFASNAGWRLKMIAIVMLLAIATSCSELSDGGGGIVGTGRAPEQPRNTDGVSIGILEGFGSIVVNGRRFETENANFLVNEQEANIADFKVGMNISASVDFETMVATEVRYQPNLVGRITRFTRNRGNNSLIILEQSVELTDDTVLDEVTLGSLTPGVTVEVSGSRDGSGNIVASYLKVVPEPESYFAVGLVEGLQSEDSVVSLSGTLVSFDNLLAASGLSEQEFSDAYLTAGSAVRAELVISNGRVSTVGCTYSVIGAPGADGIDGVNGIEGGNGVDGSDGEDASAIVISTSSDDATENFVQIIGNGSYEVSSNCLMVSEVTVVDRNPVSVDDQIELTGLVSLHYPDHSEPGNSGSIRVNGYLVRIDENTSISTRFLENFEQPKALLNESVKVIGRVQEDDIILAGQVILIDVD